jgi:hypothetical protein
VSLRSQIRAPHPLICIWCLLYLHSLLVSLPTLVRRPSTAAADTDKPKECGRSGEEDCQPGGSEHRQAETTFDVVGFEDMVELCPEGCEEDRRYEGGCEGEEESNLE